MYKSTKVEDGGAFRGFWDIPGTQTFAARAKRPTKFLTSLPLKNRYKTWSKVRVDAIAPQKKNNPLHASGRVWRRN